MLLRFSSNFSFELNIDVFCLWRSAFNKNISYCLKDSLLCCSRIFTYGNLAMET